MREGVKGVVRGKKGLTVNPGGPWLPASHSHSSLAEELLMRNNTR